MKAPIEYLADGKEIILKILDLIAEKIPPAQRAGVLLAVVLGLIAYGLAQSGVGVVLAVLATIGAIAIMLLLKNAIGLIGAGMLLVVALAGLFFVPAPGVPPVDATAENRQPVELLGVVKYENSAYGVEGAHVTVDGHSGSWATTDVGGSFRIDVPRYVLARAKDTVTFIVNKDTAVAFPRPFAETLYRLPYPRRQASPVVRLLDPAAGAARAAILVQAPAKQEAKQMGRMAVPYGGDRVRVVLDSIRVLEDGAIGPAEWRFRVMLDETVVALARSDYDDRSPTKSVKLVGEERSLQPRPGRVLPITIEGWKKSRFLLTLGKKNKAGGVAMPALPEHGAPPAPLVVSVQAGPDPDHGNFRFYFTVIHEGGPLREQQQGPPESRI